MKKLSKPDISLVDILEKDYLIEDIGVCRHEKEQADYITFSLNENNGGISDHNLVFLVSTKINSLVDYLDVYFIDIQIVNKKYVVKDDFNREMNDSELIQKIQNYLSCTDESMKFSLFRQVFFTVKDIREVVEAGEYLWFIHLSKALS